MALVLLEHNHGILPKSSLQTLTAALDYAARNGESKPVGLLLGAEGTKEAAEQAAHFGLQEVVYVADAALAHGLIQPASRAIEQVLSALQVQVILGASTSFGKAVLPRVAAHLEAGQASDVLGFPEAGLFRRPMYAGNVIADVEICSTARVITIRPAAFDAAVSGGVMCQVREITCSGLAWEEEQFVSFDTVQSERPELSEADVVVSGGRALKSAENFEKYLMPLADVLGGAIGASRAAVDSGYAPNDWQVGQTGKVVAPALYIAVGISGAIQHLAGMKDSKVIVAINTDPEAPVFEVADYGLVADLYEVIPKLTEAIARVKGK